MCPTPACSGRPDWSAIDGEVRDGERQRNIVGVSVVPLAGASDPDRRRAGLPGTDPGWYRIGDGSHQQEAQEEQTGTGADHQARHGSLHR